MIQNLDDPMRPAGCQRRAVGSVRQVDHIGLIGGVVEAGAVDQLSELVIAIAGANLLQCDQVGSETPELGVDPARTAWIACIMLDIERQDLYPHTRPGARLSGVLLTVIQYARIVVFLVIRGKSSRKWRKTLMNAVTTATLQRYDQ